MIAHLIDHRFIDLAHESDFQLGGLVVSPSTREVWQASRRIALEPRVMQVLVALRRTNGAVLSRDDLIAQCWDGRIVGDDAIHRAIGKLRRLSEHDDGESFRIQTIARVGYRLCSGGNDNRRSVPAPVWAA